MSDLCTSFYHIMYILYVEIRKGIFDWNIYFWECLSNDTFMYILIIDIPLFFSKTVHDVPNCLLEYSGINSTL